MTKNALALCVALCANSSCAMALEVMAEEELSALSAQDGITMLLALPTNGWRANEISLTDRGGISTVAGYNNDGTILAKNVGFNLCTNGVGATCTTAAAREMKFDLDTVGNINGGVGNKPMLNVAFSLVAAAKIRFYIDDIRLRNGPSGANEVTIIDFLQNYIDIVPIGSSTLFTIQLGNEALGHMLHFTNGNFGTVDFGTIAFLDKQTPANSVRFGFKLDNVDLTGSGFDASAASGLVYSAANFGGGVLNATFSDIKMGGAAAASMGTIGLQGISVSNLNVAVKGKL